MIGDSFAGLLLSKVFWINVIGLVIILMAGFSGEGSAAFLAAVNVALRFVTYESLDRKGRRLTRPMHPADADLLDDGDREP